MVLSTYRLPNGNILIWLGTGGLWGKTKGVDNVLILFGGDVLFLETVKTISLYDEKVQEDISNLSSDAIIEKYGLPANVEIVQDLKEGLKTGKYPLINQNPEDAVAEFKSMIFEYIHRISLLKDPIEKKRQFEEIRRECERQILKINRG